MIASIRGILKERSSESCVIEAAGLGYEVILTQGALAQLPALGGQVEFHTHFHVREDAQQLFGFSSLEEKQLFLMLLTVKGVGPKLGMAMLSQIGSAEILKALRKRDLPRLSSAAGVGKKLAERLAVELSDKAQKMALVAGIPAGKQLEPMDLGSEALAAQALISLGFSSQQAKLAVGRAYQQLGSGSPRVEDIVKLALKLL
jgi:Holliday junction DNA helicase RuvA